MIILVLEAILKMTDIFLFNSDLKKRFRKSVVAFIGHYNDGVIRNVKIKKEYDQIIDEIKNPKTPTD